ncbi:hypothetical protein AbraIFM66950_007402 [Aspergillus brasiliensis]|nr:hypothetical protein AbraIFM66950_007402 [Aspergillus brasiliensis]
MSGLQASIWAGGPAVVAAAGAGEDPNRGGRNGRDGKKPPADRVMVDVDEEDWVCVHGCHMHHPGQPCPLLAWHNEAFHANRRAGHLAAGPVPPAFSSPPSRPLAAPRPDAPTLSRSQRRRLQRRRAGARGGSNLRPLPVAAEKNNTSAGNRDGGGRGQPTHRVLRMRERSRAWRERCFGKKRRRRQQPPAEDDHLDLEMATVEPSGDNQQEDDTTPDTGPLDGMGEAEMGAISPAGETQPEETTSMADALDGEMRRLEIGGKSSQNQNV